jgi:8-oxo-dGTP pyrophosphatase MutT (NUDIX family)
VAVYEYGDRIGRTGRLRPGCTAVIREPAGAGVLLTRRTDNGRWCLPGGAIEPGESVAEACIREVFEETGLHVRPVRITGVYSTPHILLVFADGNRWQVVAINFLAEITGGELGLSDETTEAGFFSAEQMQGMDIVDLHRERIADALVDQQSAVWN